jgi:hypothetical protein
MPGFSFFMPSVNILPPRLQASPECGRFRMIPCDSRKGCVKGVSFNILKSIPLRNVPSHILPCHWECSTVFVICSLPILRPRRKGARREEEDRKEINFMPCWSITLSLYQTTGMDRDNRENLELQTSCDWLKVTEVLNARVQT